MGNNLIIPVAIKGDVQINVHFFTIWQDIKIIKHQGARKTQYLYKKAYLHYLKADKYSSVVLIPLESPPKRTSTPLSPTSSDTSHAFERIWGVLGFSDGY